MAMAGADSGRQGKQQRRLYMAAIGHRPPALGGYTRRVEERLFDLARAALRHYQPEGVLCGLELGWDMAVARAALSLELPLTVALAYPAQARRWPSRTQARFYELCRRASEEIIVCDTASPAAHQLRSEWLVDEASQVLALWNGAPGQAAGGIVYAESLGRPVLNLWASWVKFAGI